MAKVLYVLKIWLFREQFRMTKGEQNGIRELAAGIPESMDDSTTDY